MPFATDTAWPAGLPTIFDSCRQKLYPVENRYHGPYNKLLTYCFGSDAFEFFVSPQGPPIELSPSEVVNFKPFFIVFDRHCHPVLVAEIEDDAWVGKAHLRLNADARMRQRYDSLLADCRHPHLWGLSLLGTSLRVYRGDIATYDIDPVFEPHASNSRLPPHDFLEGAWDINILSQAGFNKMKEIVADIVGGAQV